MIGSGRRDGDSAGPSGARVLYLGSAAVAADAAARQAPELAATPTVRVDVVADLDDALARLAANEAASSAPISALVVSGVNAAECVVARVDELRRKHRGLALVFLVDRARCAALDAVASDGQAFVIDSACAQAERIQTLELVLRNAALTRCIGTPPTVRGVLAIPRRSVAATRRMSLAAPDGAAGALTQDPLTGLPGRAALHARLDVEIARVAQDPSYEFALLILDLDHFKVINDSFGHTRADALLVDVGRRLQDAVRGGDFVCRIGADEFGVILSDVRGRARAVAIAQRLLCCPSTLVAADGRSLPVTASIGGVISDVGTGRTPDDVLRKASLALTEAKARGGARVELFNPEEHGRSLVELDLEPQILRGIRADEFSLYHQAVVSLTDGRIHGFEALLRWHHPVLGLVAPGAFIPMLESSGLIEPLGEWIISRACRDLELLQQSRPGAPLFVNLNVSHRQLLRVGFAEMMLARVAAAAVDPRCLGVELTETAVIDNFEVVAANIATLRAAGLRVFVDDFGVGYSSLSSLSRLPVDALKIDRSFVASMGATPRNAALVGKIVEIGHVLQLPLVAEGIETVAELAGVLATGCDYAQGYFFARPVPLDDARQLVASNPIYALAPTLVANPSRSVGAPASLSLAAGLTDR